MISGEWRYTPEFEYAKQIDASTLNGVVKSGTFPIVCDLTGNKSYGFDIAAQGNAILTAAALPLSANAEASLRNGKVSSISVSKLYIDGISFFQPYSDSLMALSPGAPVRSAVQGGGYYVATAVLVVDGYSVDVKYGPEFDANAAAQVMLASNDKDNLKADVKAQYKDAHTLTYTVPGRTAVAIVARPLGTDFKIQSAKPTDSAPSGPQFGSLASRGW